MARLSRGTLGTTGAEDNRICTENQKCCPGSLGALPSCLGGHSAWHCHLLPPSRVSPWRGRIIITQFHSPLIGVTGVACEGAVHRHWFDFFLRSGLSGGVFLSYFLLLWFLQLQLSGALRGGNSLICHSCGSVDTSDLGLELSNRSSVAGPRGGLQPCEPAAQVWSHRASVIVTLASAF